MQVGPEKTPFQLVTANSFGIRLKTTLRSPSLVHHPSIENGSVDLDRPAVGVLHLSLRRVVAA